MTNLFKYFFYISVLFLIIISLYPGSLLGYFLYNDLSRQLILFENPLGENINHFIAYICISFLGLSVYYKTHNFKKVFYNLLILSIILEIMHLLLPNRSFQIIDLLGNILGVVVAYLIVKFYLYSSSI